MIYINNFTISSDGLSINVNVETTPGETITSALVWSDSTFKDYSQAIDISSYLEQASNTESFILPASVFGVSKLDGIYFIEFQTSSSEEDECENCSNTLGIAASLICFKECLLNKVLELSVCDGFKSKNSCNDTLMCDIINISTIIDALCTSLEFGYYQEALNFLETLRKLCDCSEGCSNCKSCTECDDLPNPNFKSGLDYGTLDNTLILV